MKLSPPFRLIVCTSAAALGLFTTSFAQDPFEGKPDEPQRLEKRPAKEGEPRKERKPDGMDEKLANMKREAQELHRAGRHEEADRLERELHAVVEKRETLKREGSSQDPAERLRHVKEAIGHLHAAGLHEPAEHLQQMAEQMRVAVDGKRAEMEKRKGPQGDAGTGELRQELDELRGQMKKMSQQMQELRAQIQKSREGEARKD